MKHHLCTLLLAAAVLGGCNSIPAPQTSSISALPAQSFAKAWRAQLQVGDEKITQLFLRDDLLIAYSDKHYSYVVKRDGGVQVSAVSVVRPNERLFPPIVLGDKIYYPSDTSVIAYGRKDSKYKGTMTFRFSVRSPGVGEGHWLYFGADRTTGRLMSVDVNEILEGKTVPVVQRWDLATNTGKGVTGSPAVYQGIVYAAFGDGKVYAVNSDTRQGVWATKDFNDPNDAIGYFHCEGDVVADLRVDGNALYVASLDTRLYCINRTTGKMKWDYFAQEQLDTAPEVTGSLVYQYVPSKGMLAFEKNNTAITVTPKWAVADATKFLAEDDKYSYLLCPSGSGNVITAVNKLTGEKKFSAKRTDLTLFVSNPKDAVIYAGTASGEVMAITPNFKPGVMGEMVMDLRDSPIAVATAR